MPKLEVRRNRERQRFELHVDSEHAGHITYVMIDGVLVLDHTKILSGFEGRGLASKLAKAVFDELRAGTLPFQADCPYLRRWLSRHPNYSDVALYEPA